MKVSVNWLRALAPDIEGTAEELAARLSMRAVPVESVEDVGAGLDDVVVGRVVSAVKHPNADRLTLCAVDDGSEAQVAVVCGAPNVVEGALYPYVRPGATLPGGFRIESREIRGETSHGMLCSERELGLGRDAAGILRLGDGHRPGQPVAEALGLPDARLELELSPNRIDLACHVGVARELSPTGEGGIRLPDVGGPGWEPEWVDGDLEAEAAGVRIEIQSPDRCRRYLAAIVRGVTVGPSPEWLASRLRAAGARPINNVVDSTNYVLLELNQPLHAFDLSKIEGSEILVRAARDEPITTLDGAEHALSGIETVIADSERPVALAGVMGGADSEVGGATTDILIECAAFDPLHTRSTARAAGLATDASYRFERGIDETGLEAALARCVDLIVATAGGTAEASAVRVGDRPPATREVMLRTRRVRQVLGLRLSGEQIAGLLGPLGLRLEPADEEPGAGEAAGSETLRVSVPGWRVDIAREIDLVEEVARRYGYDAFPDELRSFRPSTVPDDPAWGRAERVRRALVARGFLEARSASFVAEELTSGSPVPLLRPLSSEEGFLRTDLTPVLLKRLEHNFTRSRRDVRLFEIGSVFGRRPEPAGGGEVDVPFAEEIRVGVVLTGRRTPEHWSGEGSDLDVWDLKGIAEGLARELGLGEVGSDADADDETAALPLGARDWLGEDTFRIVGEGGTAGIGGGVAAAALDAPPWSAPVWALEFRLESVALETERSYRPLPTHPAVPRDLALTVPPGVAGADVEAVIREAASDRLESVSLFDLYEGESIGEDRRSLAWRLVFRAPDRTLTDEDVEAEMAAITSALEGRLEARIRSS